jgi:hypothetical protein
MECAGVAGRKTGGREKGTPNHATQEIKALAGLMRYAENEATRLAAIREMPDRGVGRPALHADIKSEVQTTPHNYREVTDEELMEIIERGLAEREGGDG